MYSHLIAALASYDGNGKHALTGDINTQLNSLNPQVAGHFHSQKPSFSFLLHLFPIDINLFPIPEDMISCFSPKIPSQTYQNLKSHNNVSFNRCKNSFPSTSRGMLYLQSAYLSTRAVGQL